MILLDTHVVAWLALRPERLSRPARRFIDKEARRAGLAVAAITLMELAQMAASGKIRIARTPRAWLKQVLSEGRLVVMELTAEVAAVAAFLPPAFPRDPFDRLIAATAIVAQIPLVTADERIQKSGVVRTIW